MDPDGDYVDPDLIHENNPNSNEQEKPGADPKYSGVRLRDIFV